MKINEAEKLVGITKKNIRFYEQEGLLTPRRCKENGYRDYSLEDIETLRKIKLLRKLGIPLEEIRRMAMGQQTLQDCMRRHQVLVERQEENLLRVREFCRMLLESGESFGTLQSEKHLTAIENMEREGAVFVDGHKRDIGKKLVAPVAVATGFSILMLGILALLLWAWFSGVDAENAPPFAVVVVIGIILLALVGGVIAAMCQRIKEIRGGEEDAARKY